MIVSTVLHWHRLGQIEKDYSVSNAEFVHRCARYGLEATMDAKRRELRDAECTYRFNKVTEALLVAMTVCALLIGYR